MHTAAIRAAREAYRHMKILRAVFELLAKILSILKIAG
jgi:hypothetical protein